MKKLFVAVLLLTSSLWAQLPPFPANTLDEAIALINKDGFGLIAVTNVPLQAAQKRTEIKTGEFVFGAVKESPYRAELFLISSTRLNHPYSFNTNALISKLEASGFTKVSANEWVLKNGNVKAEARFGGVAFKMWEDPAYYELSVGFTFRDPSEPKTKETIKLW